MVDNRKHFKLISQCELIFYNLDAIKDTDTCVIVEGEIDALSFLEAGIDYVISVPNGATKGNNNLEYLDNTIEWFDNKTKIYLATDNDEAGLNLRNELLRRLGADRCFKIDLLDCKDANDYLLKYGAEKLKNTINEARPFPIEGVVFVQDEKEETLDLWKNGFEQLKPINWTGFDDYIKIESGRLMTITGIPGHGKGELVDMLILKTNLSLGWKWIIYSPENHPVKLHIGKLAEKLVGKSFFNQNNKMSFTEVSQALEYLNDNVYFIKLDDNNFKLDYILQKSREMVMRFGVKGLVIDPWNKLEHQTEKGESETNYISRQLDKILINSQVRELLTLLVAHPTKMKKRDSIHYDIPTLYDINGSANFYNKTDYGLTIYRDFQTKQIDIYFQKVKFKHLGEAGVSQSFGYNINNGRLDMLVNADSIIWDNNNWLSKITDLKETPQIQPNLNFSDVEQTEIVKDDFEAPF